MPLSGFNHTIHWSEFQIVDQCPPGSVKEAEVVILTNLIWQTAAQSSGDCQVVGVKASLRVDHNKSWVLKGKKGVYLRHHEQGHYDITAIGMREMYNMILALVKTRCEEINQEAHRIQHNMQQLIDNTRLRYHHQTNHGSNLNVQKAWEAQIRSVKLRSDGVLAELPK
ncbi:DUF922 domain-containing protein [Kaarinaea lacus]